MAQQSMSFAATDTSEERHLTPLDKHPSIPANAFDKNGAGRACGVCGYDGGDVLVEECGCVMHVRCIPLLSQSVPITNCPLCRKSASSLHLFPMNFTELDLSLSTKNGGCAPMPHKRRKCGKTSVEKDCGAPLESSTKDNGWRTGRWPQGEVEYADALVREFGEGRLPLPSGVKLNDFLGRMLRCKQSRLTKKMKNARLSSRVYCRGNGFLEADQARVFSRLESQFLKSVSSEDARTETRFHLQREWREQFSSLCIEVGQPLCADDWLASVEELERRDSVARDAARHTRRKVMMGYSQERETEDDSLFCRNGMPSDLDILSLLSEKGDFENPFNEEIEEHRGVDPLQFVGGLGIVTGDPVLPPLSSSFREQSMEHSNDNVLANIENPFISKIFDYCSSASVPFEYVEVWVPAHSEGHKTTRLCYAGNRVLCATDQQTAQGLSDFGEYSSKFSFPSGSGLPGRVFESGVPVWEQSIHHAPRHHFERCAGAARYGVRTVLGIPVSSPSVGRVVVALMSCVDVGKDCKLVGKLCDEFSNYVPVPKWKLVLDCGSPPGPNEINSDTVPLNLSIPGPPTNQNTTPKEFDSHEIISLLGEFMPCDPDHLSYIYAPGFISLRLMLLRSSVREDHEKEILKTLYSSYASYKNVGRSRVDTAALLARDSMFLMNKMDMSMVNPMATPQVPPSMEMTVSDHGSRSDSITADGSAELPISIKSNGDNFFSSMQLLPLCQTSDSAPSVNSSNFGGGFSINSAGYMGLNNYNLGTTPSANCHVISPYPVTTQPALVLD